MCRLLCCSARLNGCHRLNRTDNCISPRRDSCSLVDIITRVYARCTEMLEQGFSEYGRLAVVFATSTTEFPLPAQLVEQIPFSPFFGSLFAGLHAVVTPIRNRFGFCFTVRVSDFSRVRGFEGPRRIVVASLLPDAAPIRSVARASPVCNARVRHSHYVAFLYDLLLYPWLPAGSAFRPESASRFGRVYGRRGVG